MQLGPQELELQVVVGCHVDPLGGQPELLAAEPTLQLILSCIQKVFVF